MNIFHAFYLITNAFRNCSFKVRKFWLDIVAGTFMMFVITLEWAAFCPSKIRARNQ